MKAIRNLIVAVAAVAVSWVVLIIIGAALFAIGKAVFG